MLTWNILRLAGWPILKVFDIKRASIDNHPPEAVDVALVIAKIPDPRARKQVMEVVRILLKKYFNQEKHALSKELLCTIDHLPLSRI